MRKIGITGIDTNVGKTIVSAIVTEALKSDYWKLIQAGDLDDLDSTIVKQLISNSISKIHPERYLLSEPMSPHAAANIDGVEIKLSDFVVPKLERDIIIEGAGGLLVPINEEKETVADLFKLLVDEVILVSRHYLGSINHTLLSVNYLQRTGLKITGIIFVGDENAETERIIAKNTDVFILGRIPITNQLNQNFIAEQALKIANELKS